MKETEATPPPRPRGLPWFPVVVAVLALGILAWIRFQPELERNLANWFSTSVLILAAVLVFLWSLCSRRFRGRTRLLMAAAAVGLFLIGRMVLRVEGTADGTGRPKFVWRWSKPVEAGGIPKPATGPNSASVPAGVPSADPRLRDVVDSPQFMGPNRDGILSGSRLATNWPTMVPRELWRQPVGAGWGAFAVVGGRALTQEQRGEQELVTCYDLLTGKLLWSHADDANFFQWQGGHGPRATPTVVDGRVFTFGATGILNALDLESGRVLWTRSVLTENQRGNIEWGMSASPLVTSNSVIVTGGNDNGPVLFAYDRETGKALWKAGEDHASYSSPVVAKVAGREVILSFNAVALTAHDPATGVVLLSHPWGNPKWPKAAQPVVVEGDRVFLSAGYGMGCSLLKISGGTDGKLSSTEVWKGMRMKNQFNTASVRGRHLYGLDDGRLACVDIETGERLWKDGNYGSGQSLIVDDLILIQHEAGSVHVAAARSDGFVELGRIESLSSKTWNFPTLAGRFLLVRNDREAVCYELPGK